MIRVLLLFVSAFLFSQFCAKAQSMSDWAWAKHDSLGYEPKGMAIDQTGNIYVLYKYRFAKFSPSGKVLWHTVLVNGKGIATDGVGNVYVAGHFGMPTQIDTISINTRGQQDIFLAKFNPQGKVFWVRTAGGTGSTAPMPGSIDDAAFALNVDAAGNSYIAGNIHTLGTSVYFDSVTIPPFSGRGFGAKYDTNGKIKWVWMLGVEGDEGMKVASGPQGSVYYSTNIPGRAVSKFNADGSVAWHKPINGQAKIEGLGVDQAGNCFISGGFAGNISFGSTTLTAPSGLINKAFFVTKYDVNGNPDWATQSTGGATTVSNLTLDQQGHPHVTGSTNGTVSFGANFAITTGNEDVFAMKFDALNGAPVWAQTGGSSGIDVGQQLKTLPNGDCIIAGSFHRTANFGNITVQPTQTTYPDNAFLAKISLNPLGVPETALYQNLLLYPNPAVSDFLVKSEETGAVQLQVFNLAGARVWEGSFEQQAMVSVQNWPAGMYLVKLTSHGNTLIRKLAIVR